MPETGLSGLAGGVRFIPHPYPIRSMFGNYHLDVLDRGVEV